MATRAQIKANNKYRDKTYDRLEIVLPAGRKEEIKQYAEDKGESVSAFVVRLIDTELAPKLKND